MEWENSTSSSSSNRQIRVFISSTFRDMKAERDYLVKFIFPQLRKLCESRQVVWGEVDLRWGVTDEQKAEGKVLPIVMEEIRRCRPYFIGLLGERYGLPYELIPEEIINREPWLREYADGHTSLTELEILHGVLRDPTVANHAFFYFRDPNYLNHLPAGSNLADFVSKNPESKARLASLKKKIRESGARFHENYSDPKALGERVLNDLMALIDRLFPKGSEPDPLHKEAAEHEAYAQSRRTVYIGREEYFARLDAHAEASDDKSLVVLGESGSGKSALLANWVARYREKHPDNNIINHFIGSSSHSADWAAMLMRIMGEFKRRFDIQGDIPDKPDELRMAFANWLHMAAARGKIVIVLDALNQLEDRDQALDLVWLPPEIPENVRLILSTLPGRPLDDLNKRNWPSMQVEPLTEPERATFIVRFLGLYTKALEADPANRIANAKQTSNPLYLKALLDELRQWGEHFTLDKQIDYYLEAANIEELYEQVLERYEKDYERERPGLVRDAMTAIWASRRGLSEAELLEILNPKEEPLPQAIWSPLHLAAEQSLMSHSGLISFAHDYMRQAVQNKYLSLEEEQKQSHLELAGYFEQKELTLHKVDELPWQYRQTEAWQKLYNLLIDLEFFAIAWVKDEYEVKTYWASIENKSPLRLIDAYKPVLDAPTLYQDYIWEVGKLLGDTGHPDEALELRSYLVNHFRNIGNKQKLSECLGNQGWSYYSRGELNEAMKLNKEQEDLCKEVGDKNGLSRSLGNQAIILKDWGEYDEAMILHMSQKHLCIELGNRPLLSSCLGNQASLHYLLCEFNEAMTLYKEQESLCRELGDKDGIQICLGNQANVLFSRGELDESMKLHKEEERVCRELGNKDGLQRTFGNQAIIFMERGELDEAMKLYRDQEQICRDLGLRNGLAISLGNQALILKDRGDLDKAMKLHKEEERIFKELGNKDGLQRTFGNQAIILQERGELDEAMKLHKEEERICKQLGNKDGLQRTFGNQAIILKELGELDEAMKLYRDQEQICRDLGLNNGLAASLGNQALILNDRGDLDEAMKLHKEEERICKELGNTNGLVRSLMRRASILSCIGKCDEAMKLYEELEHLCEELEDKDSLQFCFSQQALILFDKGELEQAMILNKKQERLCIELGNKDGLQFCFGNQANILYSRGEFGEAMTLLKQQESICLVLGNKKGLLSSLSNQGRIFIARGNFDKSLELFEESESVSREIENVEDLVMILSNKAYLLAVNMNEPKRAVPDINEAFNLAIQHNMTQLSEQIKPLYDIIKKYE